MVSYPGVILAFVFLDNILSNFKKYTKTGKAFSGIIFMVIFTILTNFSATVVYSFFAEQNVQLRFKKDIIFKYNFKWENLDYAKKLKEILGRVDFVVPEEVYYYIETEQKDLKKFPSYVDLFTYEDCEKIIKFMKEENTSICIEKTLFENLDKKYKEEIDNLLETKYKKIYNEKRGWIIFINEENFDNIEKVKSIKEIEEIN